MTPALRWVGGDARERIAQARLECYGAARKDHARYQEGVQRETQAPPGEVEWLLAERGTRLQGTVTAWALHMWVRGARVPCQGVAWVGTTRPERRKGGAAAAAASSGAPSEKRTGVATELMLETVRHAREREQVVSALMPFRATFYEHFGYGIVERRCHWTVPLTLLPTGDTDGMRYYEPADLPEMSRTRQRIVEQGQCDIERSDWWWSQWLHWAEDGLIVVDRPREDGPVPGWLWFVEQRESDRPNVRVLDAGYDSPESFARQLRFLGGLRDQYAAAVVTTPYDYPLNWVLRERQLGPNPTTYPTADVRVITRMMLRVLDHKRLLEAMRWQAEARGRAVIAVQECEGGVSRFGIDVADGRAAVQPSAATPDVEMPDRIWAPIICGALSASDAAQAGLLSLRNARVLPLLDACAVPPRPFCREAF